MVGVQPIQPIPSETESDVSVTQQVTKELSSQIILLLCVTRGPTSVWVEFFLTSECQKCLLFLIWTKAKTWLFFFLYISTNINSVLVELNLKMNDKN